MQVTGVSLDTASLADIKRFAKQLKQTSQQPLDVIICNAGIMCPVERQESEDGFEYQFACNYLGTACKHVPEIYAMRRVQCVICLVLCASLAASTSTGGSAGEVIECSIVSCGECCLLIC